jgi:hypothetical protein
MSRAYIDHKGVLDTYKLTDGTEKRPRRVGWGDYCPMGRDSGLLPPG